MKLMLLTLMQLLLLVEPVECFSFFASQGTAGNWNNDIGTTPQEGKTHRDEALEDNPLIEVVGASGRIGSLFLKHYGALAVPRGVVPGSLSKRGCPIVVATPSREWKAIQQISSRKDDLVWIGNGLLSDWQRNSTIILPHFGVLEVNADPTTSLRSPPTYVYGKHASQMANFLESYGIRVERVDSWEEICKFSARKLLWASCMWLLCHDNDPPLTLSKVHESKEDQLKQLVNELLPCLDEFTESSTQSSLHEFLDYMRAYSFSMPDAIPSKQLANMEMNDRNGVWLRCNQNQKLHVELLHRVAGPDFLPEILHENDLRSDTSENDTLSSSSIYLSEINLKCIGNSDADYKPVDSAIVVGAGIIGSSVALALKARGISDVIVLDPDATEGVGQTTPASWAWLNANQKYPVQYKWLNQMGMRAWRKHSLMRHLPLWKGSLVCFEKELENSGGYNIEGPLSRQRLKQLEPEACFPTVGFTYFFPDEGLVDPCQSVNALKKEASRLGVKFFQERVIGVIRNGEGIIGVRTRAENGKHTETFERTADVTIVAAGTGAASKELGGVPLQVSPGRIAFAMPCKSSKRSLTRILVDTINESHILQRNDGSLVMGGGYLQTGGSTSTGVGLREKTHESAQDGLRLLELATDLAPDIVKNATYTGSEGATRPIPQDGLPVVGFLEKGLYAVVSHSGITLSLLLGQLVAAELSEQMSLEILLPYRYVKSRFVSTF